MAIMSAGTLAVTLSKLQGFDNAAVKAEQYVTPSAIAADWLHRAAMLGDIEGRLVYDLGCGTGILGIGALLMGADKVIFVDNDEQALAILQQNINSAKLVHTDFDVVMADIRDVDVPKDAVVLQNPPFGTKIQHADRNFLGVACLADIVYSMHKSTTVRFVQAFARDAGFSITHFWAYVFAIKNTFSFHKKPRRDIDVTVFRLRRIK